VRLLKAKDSGEDIAQTSAYDSSAALPPGFVVILSLIASNVAGHTKSE
jgi:hypothetical protein